MVQECNGLKPLRRPECLRQGRAVLRLTADAHASPDRRRGIFVTIRVPSVVLKAEADTNITAQW